MASGSVFGADNKHLNIRHSQAIKNYIFPMVLKYEKKTIRDAELKDAKDERQISNSEML